MNKRDKINFLNGLNQGKRSVNELIPVKRVTEFFEHVDDNFVLLQGQHFENRDIVFTREEFEKHYPTSQEGEQIIYRQVIFQNYSGKKSVTN